ncbi:MAG: IS66 family insertion sequence element accessory protein TnpA [Pseudomonadales bacterium]
MARWRHSGGSIRVFCWQHGVAVSTIGLWRKRLNHEQQLPVAPPLAVTADTAFIAAATVAVPNVLPASDPAPLKSRDQVVVMLGGARTRGQ